jgi:Protein of unknown function (DUF904).
MRDRRNEELELEYAKAIDTITRLQTRIKKLEDENTKLRRQNDILMRAIEITLTIPGEKQNLHLKEVLEKLRG